MSQTVAEIAKDLLVAALTGNGNASKDGKWIAEQYKIICQGVGEAERANQDAHNQHYKAR